MTDEIPVETQDKKPPKYVFNCTKCGECCEKRKTVPITLKDLQKWAQKGLFPTVIEFIDVEASQTAVNVVLKKSTDDEGCPLYDKDNKNCKIYMNMPDECRSFPLGYNGQKYYTKKFVKCPGIGQGTMTNERLQEDRKAAQDAYENTIESMMSIPLVYAVILNHLQKQQEKVLNQMSDEEKAKLGELFKQKQPEK